MQPAQRAPSLSPADTYEAGGDSEAVYCWNRLQALSLSSDEILFINQLRELYRLGTPLNDPAGFVPGGSLFFQGANMRIAGDNGAYYNQWRFMALDLGWREGIGRGSSHESDVKQFEIKINGAGAVLVGIHDHPGVLGGPHTWCQSEKHAATGNIGQSIGHGLSFLDHLANDKKQVGAFGYSPYSEKQPEPNNPVVVRNAPMPLNQCSAGQPFSG